MTQTPASAQLTMVSQGGHDQPAFGGMVRSELIKFTRQRFLWWFVGGMFLLTLLRGLIILPIALGANNTGGPGILNSSAQDNAYQVMTQAMSIVHDISGLFVMVTAVFIFAREYQGGTIRIVLARGAGRLRLLGAKFAALAITSFAMLALLLVVTLGIIATASTLVLHDLSLLTNVASYYWSDVGTYLLGIVVNLIASGIFAVFLSVLGRTLVFGIGIALPYFFAESIISTILTAVALSTRNAVWYNITTFFFGVNLNQVASTITGPRVNTLNSLTQVLLRAAIPGLVTVDGTRTLIVIGIYAALFLIGAIFLTQRRDVTQ